MKVKWSTSIFVVLTIQLLSTNLAFVAGAPVNPEETTEETSPEPTYSLEERMKCSQMIGHYKNDVFERLEVQYDLKSILLKYGGAPGKVNATWVEKKDAPVPKNATDERPLPIADEQYWLYSYTGTDTKHWARGEHAVRRFSGTPKAFLEIRGSFLWTPDDLCGYARMAYYTVDDRGFTFQVTREYCWLGWKTKYSCAWPSRCYSKEDGTEYCVSAPSYGLLATLVGGGK